MMAEPDNPEKEMTDLLETYENHSKKLKVFVVQSYESMNDIATQLAVGVKRIGVFSNR